MVTKSNVIAYSIAAIAVVAAAVLYFQNRSLDARLDDLRVAAVVADETAAPATPIVAVEPDAAESARELTAELAEANAQIATLQEQLATAKTAAPETIPDAE
ncbi:MAG: hypothetical protein WD873_06805, partial [Candidatus Hydrogenedentales bacterium]